MPFFNDSLAISHRPAKSDGKPVEGWLLEYRRPVPAAKSTEEKSLYGRLSELNIETEDWIIIDPKDNDIRESATSNLIFVNENKLIIPEKRILQGIILRQLLPLLNNTFSIIREAQLIRIFLNFRKFFFVELGEV